MKQHTVKITNETEMVGYLKSVGTECRFISMLTETAVKMRKTGNPYAAKGITKVSYRNGLINVNYVNAVKRNMAEAQGVKASEVAYEAGSTWYVHCETAEGKAMPLCVDKKTGTKHYLQYFPHRNLGTKYVYDGQEIAREKFAQFEQESDRGEFKPAVITLAMASIREIKFRKIKAEQMKPKSDISNLVEFKDKVITLKPATELVTT